MADKRKGWPIDRRAEDMEKFEEQEKARERMKRWGDEWKNRPKR